MRRSLIGVVLLSLAALIGWPAIVVAGGWSTVKLDAVPTDVVAGQGFTVGFTVLQHGERPLADLQPYITVTNAETGERLRFDATAQGEVGHYQARITFPHVGTWDWSVNAFEGDHWMPPLTVLAPGRTQTDPAPTFAPASSEARSRIASFTPGRLIALGLGSAGVLLLVAAALLSLRVPGTVASVRSADTVPQRLRT